jgi:hypothetical protein
MSSGNGLQGWAGSPTPGDPGWWLGHTGRGGALLVGEGPCDRAAPSPSCCSPRRRHHRPARAVGGCLTRWHAHHDLCSRDPGRGLVSGVRRPGGRCPPGQVPWAAPAMLHTWVIDLPGGPFATHVPTAASSVSCRPPRAGPRGERPLPGGPVGRFARRRRGAVLTVAPSQSERPPRFAQDEGEDTALSPLRTAWASLTSLSNEWLSVYVGSFYSLEFSSLGRPWCRTGWGTPGPPQHGCIIDLPLSADRSL